MSETRKIGPLRVRPYVYRYKGKEVQKWRVDIPASVVGNGKRKNKLFDKCKEALDFARALRKRIDPVTGQLVARQRQSGVSLADIVPFWTEDEEVRVATLKKRASTLEGDLHRLKALKAFFGGRDLRSLSKRDLGQYQKSRLEQGRKPRTINREMQTFSVVMSWAREEGYIGEVPKIETVPVQVSSVAVPTPDEAVRIIEALPRKRLMPLVRFLFETGCRPGEGRNLTWEQVDELGGYVEIVSRDGWTPKTAQSERRIPLNAALLEMIRALPKKGLYVFAGPDPDKPIGRFDKAFTAAVKRAKVMRRGKPVHLTPHVCRKAHATWQVMNGTNESVLQDLMGHAKGSRITQQFYVHATEEAKKAAVIALPIKGQKKAKSDQELRKTAQKDDVA